MNKLTPTKIVERILELKLKHPLSVDEILELQRLQQKLNKE